MVKLDFKILRFVSKKVFIRIKGGLGNQLFQYAAAKAMAKRNNAELILDVYTGFYADRYSRRFELHNFLIDAKIDSYISVFFFSLKRLFIKFLNSKFDIFSSTGNYYFLEEGYPVDLRILNLTVSRFVWLEGYFHSELYFNEIRDELLNEFRFRHSPSFLGQRYLAIISNCESVSVHVRNFDHSPETSTASINGLCSLDYYRRAIEYVLSVKVNPWFFIFSDDINYAKKFLNIGTSNVYFINYNNQNSSHEDLRLMIECKNNIIANSSFSWWGAWLNGNPNKVVIAPKRWSLSDNVMSCAVTPEGWYLI